MISAKLPGARYGQSFFGLVIIMFCMASMPLMANTIYLVRHAEKQDGEKQSKNADPALSECGMARAEALAQYFKDIPLKAVYATPYKRTQQTAAAVAGSKQLAITTYDPKESEQLRAKLAAEAKPALIVGHSNTVPQLVALLSGIEVAPLSEQNYSMFYQLELGDQPSVTIRRQAFKCEHETH